MGSITTWHVTPRHRCAGAQGRWTSMPGTIQNSTRQSTSALPPMSTGQRTPTRSGYNYTVRSIQRLWEDQRTTTVVALTADTQCPQCLEWHTHFSVSIPTFWNSQFDGFTQMEFDFFFLCIWFPFTFYSVQFCYSLDMRKQLKYLFVFYKYCYYNLAVNIILKCSTLQSRTLILWCTNYIMDSSVPNCVVLFCLQEVTTLDYILSHVLP